MNGKTIEDVAKAAGCSVGTVSRAINNRKGVGEKTKQRIFRVMEEIGYQPNAIAQSLAQKQTHSIAVIIPDISHNFLGNVALAIEEELARHQYDMILFNTRWNPEIERQKIQLAEGKRVDGIILKPAVDNIDFMSAIHNTPTVLVSQTYSGGISYVDIDNDQAGYMATHYLLERKYRKIAFMGGLPVTGMIRQRYEGYVRALKSEGIPVQEDLICYSDYTIESGFQQFAMLMQRGERPDAVFCSSDTSALGVYKYATEHNISVPKELGIIGFNNDEIAGLPQVELTTINQPRYQIGQMAAQMVVNMIENRENWKPQKIILNPELLIRKTTR